MITIEQYFGAKISSPDATPERQANAAATLKNVNDLLEFANGAAAYDFWIDPDTGTQISGAKGGAGDGGFRLSGSATGAVNSKHKLGAAVDVYDPHNTLDDWLTDEILALYGLYREAPGSTPGWCHLQSIPPGSGRHTFQP